MAAEVGGRGGGGSISRVASGDLGRAEEAGRRAPDLAQLQPTVAHQLCSLGAGAGFPTLGLRAPVCPSPEEGQARCIHGRLDILAFGASEV